MQEHAFCCGYAAVVMKHSISVQDIDTYTGGLPVGMGESRLDTFRIAKKILPGPVNIVLAGVTCFLSYSLTAPVA